MHLKPVVPVAAFALLLASAALAGCSGTPNAAATCTPEAASGTDSDAVASAVTGDFGAEAAWSFTAPVTTAQTERTVAIAGDPTQGVVTDGMTANIVYTLFNGTTGKVVESSTQFSSDPMPFAYASGQSLPGLEKTLDCAAVGSRTVSVVPPADAFGTAGYPDEDVSGTDDIIMVIDVDSISITTPTPVPSVDLPTPQAWDDPSTIPTVDMSSTVPKITLPKSGASKFLQETVLTPGTGDVVPNGATVTVDYEGVSWQDGSVFDSSYANGSPATFQTNEVVTGFAAAIVGQKVGSTVLVSIPSDLAYPAGSGSDLAGQDLVFLIDIESAD